MANTSILLFTDANVPCLVNLPSPWYLRANKSYFNRAAIWGTVFSAPSMFTLLEGLLGPFTLPPFPLFFFYLQGRETELFSCSYWGKMIGKQEGCTSHFKHTENPFPDWWFVEGRFRAVSQLPRRPDFPSAPSYESHSWQWSLMTTAVMLGHGKLSSELVHKIWGSVQCGPWRTGSGSYIGSDVR